MRLYPQSKRWRAWWQTILLGISLVIGFTMGNEQLRAQEGPNKINRLDLYAAFLTKFPHFVEWASHAQEEEQLQIRIGSIGDESFSEQTIRSIKAQKFNGKPIQFVRLKTADDIQNVEMLFIHESQDRRVRHIIEAIRGQGILTFGAMPQFCEQGGMISFVTKGGKTRFKINLKRVSEERIKISTKILRMATLCE